MSTLFDDGMAGYRLEHFEWYNWGCFDNKIWGISPEGYSSLLTGANGSGKTTLVDALVTLLVPPGKRHYNQSSGADRKRERTEESYVLGAVGSRRGEESPAAVADYLRTKQDYSLLIGVFKNSWLDRELTLGQLRWFTGAGLKQLYFSASCSLNLKRDLLPVDFRGNFRKEWKEKFDVNFYSSFSQYMRYFLPVMGFRSEKGLNLFSHIVGVKVLGNLNEFIRIHMLDAPDMEEEFTKLHANYKQLFNAHRKIELADKQLELLEPVMKILDRYEKQLEKHSYAEETRKLLPGFFAGHIAGKLEEELREKEEEINRGRETHRNLRETREAGDRERRDLQAAIDRNDTAQRIKGIENEMRLLQEKKAGKKKSCDMYTKICTALDLPKLSSEEDFSLNRKKGGELFEQGLIEVKQLEEKLVAARVFIRQKEIDSHHLEEELASLGQRRSNIPRQNIEIRRQMAAALGYAEEQLPFAGELIRMKQAELDWELAAERILHNFALCLLVSPEQYKEVNRYVNRTNLRGRLIYFKADVELEWGYEKSLARTSLLYKLDVKKDSAFYAWVDLYLQNHFDYLCLDNVDDMAHYKMAVTREGLIKSGDKHEKDDRSRGRDHFVLGWDNKAKKALLSSQLREMRNLIEEKQRSHTKFMERKEQLENAKHQLQRLQDFTSYSEVAWWIEEEKLQTLEKEKQRLASKSGELKNLILRLAEVEKQLTRLGDEISRTDRRIGQLHERLKDLRKNLSDYSNLLEQYGEISFEAERFAPFLPESFHNLSFSDLEVCKDKALEVAAEEVRKKEERCRESENKMLRQMQAFKSPHEKILRAYPGWENFTVELDVSIQAREDYRRVYELILKDNLPKYKQEFKEFLNEKILENLIDFRQSLEQGERDIITNINELNSALHEIEYNKTPSTYLSLHHEASRDPMVKEFRSRLKTIMGDALGIARKDEAEMESLFKRMQTFILDLQQDDYRRRKVLNVRNWLRFSALEKYREGDGQKQYYEDSQSLSGGEKAKLAYTILASAIAYQFGISGSGEEERSFRFAIVDEAFSKVDPENSRYAMDLFKTLQLQLMVVTPLDKINIVEDYIHAVHFVENNGRSSSLYNLSLEEYRERKEEALAVTEAGE